MRANRFITISTLILWIFAVVHCWAECIPHIAVNHTDISDLSIEHHHHSNDSSEHDHSKPTTPCEISSAIVTDKFSSQSTYQLQLVLTLPAVFEVQSHYTYQTVTASNTSNSNKHSSLQVLTLTAPNPPPLTVI